jgi:hypothetical protein
VRVHPRGGHRHAYPLARDRPRARAIASCTGDRRQGLPPLAARVVQTGEARFLTSGLSPRTWLGTLSAAGQAEGVEKTGRRWPLRDTTFDLLPCPHRTHEQAQGSTALGLPVFGEERGGSGPCRQVTAKRARKRLSLSIAITTL